MSIPSRNNWLGTSVLGRSADAYVGYLHRHGFCAGTVQAHTGSVSHFAYWLTECRVQLSDVDEALVHQFVTEHLPDCACPGRWQRTGSEMRAALAHLLLVLRAEGRIPAARIPAPPAIHGELERYDSYLAEICGLAPATRISRRLWVGKFLADRFGASPVELRQISPRDIVDFMVRPDSSYQPGTARVLGCALRSYLRFRSLSSGDDVQQLLAAVPTVAEWSKDTLPSHLTPDEATRFLAAFAQASVSGLRGYAMARCMLDMGLRAGEVAALRLDDVNWQEGTVSVSPGKSRRADVLPLPAPTGKAIVRYLRGARPQSLNRSLFLRHRAPFDAPVTAEFVRGHVRRAFAVCGLADRFTGTHVLRHTAAVRMRRNGASLKEIADVLRHRSLDTTAIYVKLDLPQLAALAWPWPGGLS
jgi:integrase/recombinase XerD